MTDTPQTNASISPDSREGYYPAELIAREDATAPDRGNWLCECGKFHHRELADLRARLAALEVQPAPLTCDAIRLPNAMTDELASIPPALSAEEWHAGEFETRNGVATTSIEVDHKGRLFACSTIGTETEAVVLNEACDSAALHKTAALCLHDQPFGFTMAEYQALAAVLDAQCRGYVYVDTGDEPARCISALAKIRALLPP